MKYLHKYNFGKKKPVVEKFLIRMINNDLNHTCEINQIPYNIKSHRFIINMITQLLQNTYSPDVAYIISHRKIKSTMAYKRYSDNFLLK